MIPFHTPVGRPHPLVASQIEGAREPVDGEYPVKVGAVIEMQSGHAVAVRESLAEAQGLIESALAGEK